MLGGVRRAAARFDVWVELGVERLRGRPVLDRLFYGASELGEWSLIWFLIGLLQALLPGRELLADWKPIGLFALVGTVLSTLLVGAAIAWAFALPLPVALVFGALIAPTDPISVIAVLKQLGVSPRLALIVEAESLFNDGVAVVLFLVLLGTALGQGATAAGVAGKFAWVMLGGVGVGALVGYAASLATKAFDDHLLEIMLTTIVAFGAYLAAEAVHVSGVIAVVAGGLVVGNYGMPRSMTHDTRVAVHAFWEYAAFVVNSIVFLLIGLQAFQVA